VYICRLLGGDLSLIPEIEKQNAIVGGSDFQRFMLQSAANENQVEWHEERTDGRVGTKQKAVALHDHMLGAPGWLYKKNNGMLNKSVTGMTKRETGALLGIARKKWTPRDHMTKDQLHLIKIGETASTRVFREHVEGKRDVTDAKLTKVYNAISTLSDISGLKHTSIEGPPELPALPAPPKPPAVCKVGSITDYFQ
jgi:hypothetical protein